MRTEFMPYMTTSTYDKDTATIQLTSPKTLPQINQNIPSIVNIMLKVRPSLIKFFSAFIAVVDDPRFPAT